MKKTKENNEDEEEDSDEFYGDEDDKKEETKQEAAPVKGKYQFYIQMFYSHTNTFQSVVITTDYLTNTFYCLQKKNQQNNCLKKKRRLSKIKNLKK